MPLPGFTADNSFGTSARVMRRGWEVHYRVTGSVRPASCFGDCFQECVADGGMSKPGCRAICAQDCGGVPKDNPPYVCTPTDNSVNHTLCIAAQDAWAYAAAAECNLLAAVPFVGPLLVTACKAGVERVSAENKATCPPAVICV